ncbi:MAG: hypothetical protein H6822_20980 [Planctomycetaceae bacterium]|nr:hypothetical protein [Planctomycetales bacterium]MCB9924667.1 hypothetical protein [Planctomycetaceae bacterium]
MRLQTGQCYVLWSEQIVKLCERLDETRWVAVFWDRAEGLWSVSVYAIDEHLINSSVTDPQQLAQRHTG